MKQNIEPINANEVLWIKEQLENAEKFVAAFSPADSGSRTFQPFTQTSGVPGAPDLAALDRAFAAWLDSGPAGAEINAIINCVGVAFGQAPIGVDHRHSGKQHNKSDRSSNQAVITCYTRHPKGERHRDEHGDHNSA